MEGEKPWKVESDVKILWNDWPYGIDEKIVSSAESYQVDLGTEAGCTDCLFSGPSCHMDKV